METRVAVISIIVENPEATEQLNQYLHESGILLEEWESRTVKKESILSVLRLMRRRM